MARIFVYGTLRSGQKNHMYLQEAQLIAEKVVLKGYELRSAKHYPFAYFNENSSIIGDIYQLSIRNIEHELDILEGIAQGLYSRYFDETVEAFIYVRTIEDRQLFEPIPSGDWLEYIQTKPQP